MDDLPTSQIVELLNESDIGHLAVVDGTKPYVTPVSYVFVNGFIGMRVVPGRRLDAIKENAAGCFETSTYDPDTGAWKSVLVDGQLRVETNGRDADAVVAGLLAKYRAVIDVLTGTPGLPGWERILILDPESMSGRSSGAYFSPRTRPGRL